MVEKANAELLKALEFDKNGDWGAAHKIVQDLKSLEANWIHAYLHRKEGDQDNAKYWYGRAEKQTATNTLEQEWQEIYKALS